MKEHLFDKRVVQRALQEGLLDKEAYQRMLEELPDLSHKVQTEAESHALEAASQASASPAPAPAAAAAPGSSYEGEVPASHEYSGEPSPSTQSGGGHNVSDALELEQPGSPGSYTPDY